MQRGTGSPDVWHSFKKAQKSQSRVCSSREILLVSTPYKKGFFTETLTQDLMKKALLTLRFYLILVEAFNLSMTKAALLPWIPNHPDGSDPRDGNSFGKKERQNLMKSGKVGGSGPAHTGLAHPGPALSGEALPHPHSQFPANLVENSCRKSHSQGNEFPSFHFELKYPHPCPEHCWCAYRGSLRPL